MASITQCPHCRADIEDDSFFCDQCGAELLRCPSCGKFGKVKFCTSCGQPMVKAAQTAQTGHGTPQPAAPQPVAAPVAAPAAPHPPIPTTDPPMPHQGTSVAATTTPQPSRLSCRALGIILPLQHGAIIGRVYGNYVAQLSTLSFISGTHARLDFNGAAWTITDLGSTNGTTVNGIPCAPALQFKPGDIIRIGKTYDFFAE